MAKPWALALCSVVFDTDKGQTLEECYPHDAVRVFGAPCFTGQRLSVFLCGAFPQLPEEDLLKIANLALPDSNTGPFGDVIHTFRMRM